MNSLKIGDKAPHFEAVDHLGQDISLEKLKGKKVVLYFYPKDNTPGCTAQACNLRDNIDRFKSQGYTIIGVSPDTKDRHIGFAEKYNLPFSLIPDTEKKILNLYGVWGKKKMMGREYDGVIRTTYVIDEQGVIADIISKVNTKAHDLQILK